MIYISVSSEDFINFLQNHKKHPHFLYVGFSYPGTHLLYEYLSNLEGDYELDYVDIHHTFQELSFDELPDYFDNILTVEDLEKQTEVLGTTHEKTVVFRRF